VQKQHGLVLHGRFKAGEIGDLGAKDEVTQLGEGKENDEEHHGESCQIFGTRSQC